MNFFADIVGGRETCSSHHRLKVLWVQYVADLEGGRGVNTPPFFSENCNSDLKEIQKPQKNTSLTKFVLICSKLY